MPALELWLVLQTQWRHGFNGPTGLDYSACDVAMRLRGLRRRDRGARLAELQVMERAALDEWAAMRERAAG